jgi:DNA-binding response OmpR family regulator
VTVPATHHRPLRLILVTHADGCAARLGALLTAEPAAPALIRFARLDEALRHLALVDVDCVLLDLELSDVTGTAGVERLLAAHPQVPIAAGGARGHDVAPSAKASAAAAVKSIAGSTVCHERTSST